MVARADRKRRVGRRFLRCIAGVRKGAGWRTIGRSRIHTYMQAGSSTAGRSSADRAVLSVALYRRLGKAWDQASLATGTTDWSGICAGVIWFYSGVVAVEDAVFQ